jgi:hypothetical protein|tara:strand:- start:384 stop:752 length:369 start_codon:yes stop_codon:yes gene_type:complete
MNLQQIFDKTANHLLKQGMQSVLEDNDTCAYRGQDGAMCAVGCLINDDVYSWNLEGTAIDDCPRVQKALRNSGIEFDTDGQVMRLLIMLQGIHDTKEESDWATSLRALANELGLKFDMRGIR